MDGFALVEKQGRLPEFAVDAARNRLITSDQLCEGVADGEVKICPGEGVGYPKLVVLGGHVLPKKKN